MLVCISIHADTDSLCFRPKILKSVNFSELVVQKIAYLAKGRQMLQEYQANRLDWFPTLIKLHFRYAYDVW